MMKVKLIGTGCGTVSDIQAEYVVGSRRLLEGITARKDIATRPEEIIKLLLSSGCENCAVLFSGDTGFYSGARGLLPLLHDQGIEAEVLPGVSSVQILAARLGRPWQDWVLYSAHGADCDPVAAVCGGKPAFFLTGGPNGPARLCQELTQAGLGQLPVTVGENLGFEEEAVSILAAQECARKTFAPLNVLLAEPAPRYSRQVPGIPDSAFLRAEGIPMTKQELRAVILSKLSVGPQDVCWDIGAGTGSVSVELALQCRAVWAVERKPEALRLTQANREKFGTWNLRLVEGAAPDALDGLPIPDAVFVGGSSGDLPEILQAIRCANPKARVCITAISLETLHTAMTQLKEPEITQIAVSQSKPVGQLHLLLAKNPVFLVTGVLS